MRARISHRGASADILSLTSGDAATPNGSFFKKNTNAEGSAEAGTHTLRLDAADLAAMNPDTYTINIEYFDNADASEWKNVDRQVFVLEA